MGKKYVLKLYIAGDTTQMMDLVQALRSILSSELQDSFQLDTVNVLTNPEMAIQDGVLATPTLLRVFPEPHKRVLGDLSDLKKTLGELEILSA